MSDAAAVVPRSDAAGLASRIWSAPLWAHLVALALVLLIGLALTGPPVAFSSDEGVLVIQARMLRDGDGWLYRYPLASIDREDQARPFVRGDAGTRGVAPYAKHPLYPVLLAGLDLVGGQWGMVMGGALGTLLAAGLAALLARRLEPGLDRYALWIVGVGSPLFFDAFVVLGHSLAAAGVAAAALAGMAALAVDASLRRRLLAVAAMALCLVAASMVRTEALFAGPAIALGCAALALLGRLPVRRASLVGAAGVAASACAFLIDRVWSRAIIGRPFPGVGNAAPSSWLDGRWQALRTTWFEPSYLHGRTGDLALDLGAVFLVLAALLLHRRADRRLWVLTALLLACCCYVTRLAAGPAGAIPGLALAFPVGWFLLWAAGRRIGDAVDAPLLAIAAGFTVVVVLLTEYAIGGGVEWGGRYFAIVIPVAVPALLYAAVPVVNRHGAELCRVVVAALVVLSLAAALTAGQALRHVHLATAAVLDDIADAAHVAGTSGGLTRPVVVTSNRLLPQIDHRDFGRYDWVATDPDHLTRYGDRLAALGVDRVVLVSDDPQDDLRALPGWRVVSSRSGPLDVAVLERG